MLLIGDILVSEELIEEQFVCHLDKCKGACCWEGDYGAPLEADEMEFLERNLDKLRPFLDEGSYDHIREDGTSAYYADKEFHGTPLRANGACVYLTFGDDGVAKCGIEQAWQAGAVSLRKPVSCHLYPVRVKKIDRIDFEAVNYDKWDICSAACSLGRSLKVPLYVFVKDALIRKYGEAFWNELDEVAQDYMGDVGKG